MREEVIIVAVVVVVIFFTDLVLHQKEPRHREAKQVVQDDTIWQDQSWDLNPGPSECKSLLLAALCPSIVASLQVLKQGSLS